MTRRLAEDLSDSARLDPAEHSPLVSKNRWRSFKYALAGCLYMLRYQKNSRIQLLATVAVLLLALWLDIAPTEWALIILTSTVVWLAEFINAAVEAAVNLASPNYHPMAKVAKDVAAASVLLSALASVAIGLIILGPSLIHKIPLVLGNP